MEQQGFRRIWDAVFPYSYTYFQCMYDVERSQETKYQSEDDDINLLGDPCCLMAGMHDDILGGSGDKSKYRFDYKYYRRNYIFGSGQLHSQKQTELYGGNQAAMDTEQHRKLESYQPAGRKTVDYRRNRIYRKCLSAVQLASDRAHRITCRDTSCVLFCTLQEGNLILRPMIRAQNTWNGKAYCFPIPCILCPFRTPDKTL